MTMPTGDPYPWAAWGGPPPPVRPVPHRPWSTLFLVVHAVVGAVGVLALAGAALAVGNDLAYRPGPGDTGIDEPYGLVVGAVLGVVGLPTVIVSALLIVLATRGRRAADAGAPGLLTGTAVTSLVVAGLGLMGSIAFGGLYGLATGVPLFGVYATPGIAVLVGARSG